MSVFNAGNAENLIKKLTQLCVNETNAENSSIASIKNELQMFVKSADNDATASDTVAISNQSKTLETKLTQYEKEIETLEEQMRKLQNEEGKFFKLS